MRVIFEMHLETIKMLLSQGSGQSYTQVVIDTYGQAAVFEAIGAELRGAGLYEDSFLDPPAPLLENTEDYTSKF